MLVFVSTLNNSLLTFLTPTNRKGYEEDFFRCRKKKFSYMIVLTACGQTHMTGRSVQDGLPSTSTSARGSEVDMPLNGSNSSFSKSEPGKMFEKYTHHHLMMY